MKKKCKSCGCGNRKEDKKYFCEKCRKELD